MEKQPIIIMVPEFNLYKNFTLSLNDNIKVKLYNSHDLYNKKIKNILLQEKLNNTDIILVEYLPELIYKLNLLKINFILMYHKASTLVQDGEVLQYTDIPNIIVLQLSMLCSKYLSYEDISNIYKYGKYYLNEEQYRYVNITADSMECLHGKASNLINNGEILKTKEFEISIK